MTRSDKASFKQRQTEFIRKHGFSPKGYLIALALLPPAAIYIALKMEQYHLIVRAAAALFVVAFHGTLLLGGAQLIAWFFAH